MIAGFSLTIERVPLLVVLVGTVCGIVCNISGLGREIAVLFVLVGLSVVLMHRISAGVAIIAVAVGWSAMEIVRPVECVTLPDSKEWYGGEVESVRESEGYRSLMVESSGLKIQLTTAGLMPLIEVGDSIMFKGRWSEPVYAVDLPGGSDGRLQALINGLSLRCFANRDGVVVVGHRESVKAMMSKWRAGIEGVLLRSSLDESASTLIVAMLTGERQGLNSETMTEFTVAGVAHVFAVSGAHVAVIWLIVSLLTLPMATGGFSRARAIVIIGVLWVYAMMTGLSPSVVRSVVMATTVIVGGRIGRGRGVVNSLCLAAIVILIVDPGSLLSAGFQLSFAATLAIVTVVPALTPSRADSRLGKIGRCLLIAVTSTVVATLATAPLVALHFGMLPLGFIVGNLVMLVLLPILIVGGAIIALCMAVGIDLVWLCDVVNMVVDAAETVIGLVAGIDGLVVAVPYFNPLWLVPLYLALGVVAWRVVCRDRIGVVGAISGLVATVLLMIVVAPVPPEDSLWVTRDYRAWTIVRQQGRKMTVYTDDTTIDTAGEDGWVKERYSDFIRHEAISEVSASNAVDLLGDSIGVIDRRGQRLLIVGRRGVPCDSLSVNYMLVTRWFRGDITELASKVDVDTIVLGCDMSQIRAKRYLGELRDAGYNARLLADRPINL